ncbi:MAG: hypothetical protein H6573_29480 [Lewinellaceae bacterium]|nr:hypothetical protein [Phaeodactylibacter sp.]MCB9351601.1 hypothetical protein [Lewinellaceae bacterium]
MYPSCEVRWFFSTAPEQLAAWFASKNMFFDGLSTPKRVDHYLLVANGKNIGIKLREGNIEAKQLIKVPGEWHFPELNTSGQIEHWIKWSFQLDEADVLSRQIIHEGQDKWIAVEKERLGYIYHFQENGANSQVPMGEWVAEGCQVELTRIEIRGKTYQTFGLEAFSDSGQMERNLKRGAETVFPLLGQWCAKTENSPDGLGFSKACSMSYPAFLLSI